ncbi:probable protein phosphatase 2C 52 [Arachis hypogaea]|uniref:probable protein phosphatase 2C 52 n=1 Tax=Arachis hypogaea TaxID=3818 RepID=UPI003B21C398
MWREAFMKAYKAMDKELRSHPNLDCFCSGSTAVTIVKQGKLKESKGARARYLPCKMNQKFQGCHSNVTIIIKVSQHRRDVLSNEEVVEIVSTAPTRASAARVLVDSAAREWKSKSKPHRIFFGLMRTL